MIEAHVTTKELRQWVIDTVRHVAHIEYYLNELGLGSHDSERPHDIVGNGNKFEWDVMSGFAMQYKPNGKELFETYIKPALTRHRCQYHHRKWNEPNDSATSDDMKLGAVDAICSLLESRDYQGGLHSWDGVIEVTGTNPPHKIPWMQMLIPEMRKLKRPLIEIITDLDTIHNIGIPKETHCILKQRAEETRQELRMRGYVI